MNNYLFYKTIINHSTLTNEEQLFQAIELCDLTKIKELIAKGVNINARNKNRITPLILAVIGWDNLRYSQRVRIRNGDVEHMRNMIEIVEHLIITVLLKNSNANKHFYFSKENELLLWENCKRKVDQETEALGKITFNTFSLWTLYKEKDADKLATMSRNETVKQLLTEPNFKEQYPCFGDKIQANFQKGLVRTKMLDTALNSLVTYNKGPKLLPIECWEKILKNLERDDLKNVTKSIFFKEVSSTMAAWNWMSSLVFRTH